MSSTDSTEFLAVVGSLALAYWGALLVCKIYGAFKVFVWARVGTENNFSKKYGQWAVITGSTDGIGKDHAKIFAERGLNICLISRNQDKLEGTAKEIQKINANVEVKCIQADFTDVNCYERIKKGLDEVDDIGVLMNNVGMLGPEWEPFEKEAESFLRDMINVNVLSAVLMTRIVLPRMTAKKRGLIINMSSMSAVCPLPYATVYSSTKAMLSTFSLCLKEELRRHNVRVVCLEPCYIRTNMTKYITDSKIIIPSFLIPTSQQYCRSASTVYNLDSSVTTTGYWSHEFLYFIRKTFIKESTMTWMNGISLRLKLLGRTRYID